MTVNWKHIVSFGFGIAISVNLFADTLHALDRIEQVAYEYALKQAQAKYDNPQIVVEALDSRLRLQACDVNLDVFSTEVNGGLGNQTIGVKCITPVAWTVYVPVKVKVLKPVVVASRPLAAKQQITQHDVKLQQIDIGNLRHSYLANMQLVIGQQLKYPLAMGTVINPASLEAQKVIHRGQQITIVANAGQMEVRMTGTALVDGTLGQRVKVKNRSSKRVVEGVVDAPGIVKVSL